MNNKFLLAFFILGISAIIIPCILGNNLKLISGSPPAHRGRGREHWRLRH